MTISEKDVSDVLSEFPEYTGWDIMTFSHSIKFSQYHPQNVIVLFELFDENPEIDNARFSDPWRKVFVRSKPGFRRYKNRWGSFLRPSVEKPFINFIEGIAQQSTCARKKVGALIIDPSWSQILCYGYNGNYKGGPNGCDCITQGNCGCIHAETNALLKSTSDLKGCICLVTLSPCINCAKVLINREISEVIFVNDYRDSSGVDLLEKVGIKVRKYEL